jgi:hypothetical protein
LGPHTGRFLNRWLAPATFTRSSNLLELGSFRELLQLRLPPRIPPAWTEQPHSVWGPPPAYPPTTPLLNQVMPLLSLGDAGSTPRASPEHPPRIPRACPIQPSSSPLMGWFKVLSTPNHPLPKPELGWGFRLPPEVLPGCGPAGVPMHPHTDASGGPQTAFKPFGLRVL